MSLLDDIRKAINESEVSRYELAKRTGINQGQLSRLMGKECGLSIANLELLADALGLEAVLQPKNPKGK